MNEFDEALLIKFDKAFLINGSENSIRPSRNVKWFRGGLVCKAHRRVYHSTLGSRERGYQRVEGEDEREIRGDSCGEVRLGERDGEVLEERDAPHHERARVAHLLQG